MRGFLLILLLTIFSEAIERKYLTPQEALQQTFIQQKDKLQIQLKLGKDIYLYHNKIKILITKPLKKYITSKINIPKPVKYDEFIVHFDDLNIEVPYKLLKELGNAKAYTLEFKFQGCSTAGVCYAPMSETITLNLDNLIENKTTTSDTFSTSNNKLDTFSESDIITNSLKNGNILIILITFFGFGLLLSLTPCVFPMIPILSSIIIKASSKEKLSAKKGFFLSFIYVFSMSVAYTIAGIIAGLFGANLQVALQNPYILSVFAIIFIILSISMFGYFKLELPQSLQNKINKTSTNQGTQGVLSIAIMGFLSALIVGPCVAAPLAGALMYIGQTGDAFLGGMALFILSFGMGVPLLLIGLGAGKYMPKPGAWMDSISKIFGLIMLGVAIFILDRVLNIQIIMFLWSFLFIATALYLQKYSHIIIKLLTTVIFIYGILVFIGAISGAKSVLQPLNGLKISSTTANKELKWQKVKNIEELEIAIKASSKPIMLDFYATWCVSCVELEEITFKDERVKLKLQNFTLLKADVSDNTDDDKALQKKYKVFAPPALIFWNKNKQEMKSSRIVGYKNAEDFLKIVNDGQF